VFNPKAPHNLMVNLSLTALCVRESINAETGSEVTHSQGE